MITWDWRTMGKTAIQVTQPRTKNSTFTCKNQKKVKKEIYRFFITCHNTERGMYKSNLGLQCSKSMTLDL